MSNKIAASMMAIAAGAAMPANAAIVVITDPPGVKTEENVLFKNLGPAALIVAPTNKGMDVSFTGDEILDAPAGGQAKISGADGDFTTLNFFATDSTTGFSAVEFSLGELKGDDAHDDEDDAHDDEDATATIRFFNQYGAVTTITDAPLDEGRNWFAALTTEGSVIKRVEITTSEDIRDARHFRIIGANVVAPVPEPATWLMLIAGFGVVGGALRRGNRRVAIATS